MTGDNSEEEKSQNNTHRLQGSAQPTPSKRFQNSVRKMQEFNRQLEDLEVRFSGRLADSVESLGQIIKEYASKYQEINERVMVLESTK